MRDRSGFTWGDLHVQNDSKAPELTVHMVCTGQLRCEGELCWSFRVTSPETQAGTERIYSQKGFKAVQVGHEYALKVDSSEPTRVYTNSTRWIRLWPNQEEAAVWQLASAAFDTEELARKREKQQTARRLPVERLKPIRDLYWRTNAAGRLASEVRVLSYLRLVPINGEES
jgi:hypothetical protein